MGNVGEESVRAPAAQDLDGFGVIAVEVKGCGASSPKGGAGVRGCSPSRGRSDRRRQGRVSAIGSLGQPGLWRAFSDSVDGVSNVEGGWAQLCCCGEVTEEVTAAIMNSAQHMWGDKECKLGFSSWDGQELAVSSVQGSD
eukprot:CAMPEP_0113477844 /NCGR_PEP_ID=MMETSP0014_2-20120614/20420_1 /TAXON_ID=2857 /ORGANISM="Nitzschia sp." /LENGTH=139 /DNA_ID=CAMNT_0000370957 /DNA_START=1814 /DNA_END=2233 /DNA_ORIENTATION=+ /assembly_acc=CAM_ASM_000159